MTALIKRMLPALLLSASVSANDASQRALPVETRDVDLVIALDVSGSMSGLINSARQRLWDVVNEIGRAQPQPRLRIALVTFGDPSYGAASGYVRIDQGFTRDLDAVNESLFALGTNGGDEYVARAVSTSLDRLQWSTRREAMKIVFVAGNESARQDPQFSVESVMERAQDLDVVVNAIYCGNDQDEIAAEWRRIPALGQGFYASIDQNAAAVAHVETPMDDALLALNESLNATYLAYGASGTAKRENQHRQDANAARMSAPAAASRVVAKAGELYDASDWDLVDALEAGRDIGAIEEESLPEPLRDMAVEERWEAVEALAAERTRIQQEIARLDRERREWIAARKAEQKDGATGLDEALVAGLKRIAEPRGFHFES